jgi:hypothetical protein
MVIDSCKAEPARYSFTPTTPADRPPDPSLSFTHRRLAAGPATSISANEVSPSRSYLSIVEFYYSSARDVTHRLLTYPALAKPFVFSHNTLEPA